MDKLFKQKMRDNKGITMIIALFSFLVCIIISIVVLRSSASSSGRIVNATKTDQMYYSVNSAVDLVKESIENEPVVIIREKVTTTKTRTRYKDDGTSVIHYDPQVISSDSKITSKFGEKKTSVERGNSVLEDAAIDYIFGKDSMVFTDEKAWNNSYRDFVGPTTTITSEMTSDISGVVSVEIEQCINSNGELEITFASGQENDRYATKLIYSPDIVEIEDTNEEVKAPVVVKTSASEYYEDVVVIRTEIKTATVKWKLISIESV